MAHGARQRPAVQWRSGHCRAGELFPTSCSSSAG